MNTTTLPNWLFVLILLFGIWGMLVSLGVIAVWVLVWCDDFKAQREKRKLDDEYAQLYQFGITYLESESMK